MRIISIIAANLIVIASMAGQKGYEIGGWLGSSFYYGDLNTSMSIKKPGIAGGLIAKYNFNTRISLKTGISYGRVGADDALSDNTFERDRNLSFRSNIFDFTSDIELNFMEYYHGSKDHYYTPYLLVGASIFHFNPQAKLNDTWYDLKSLGTEGQDIGSEYFSISSAMTLGIGFKYDINRDFSLNFEVSTHRTFTDYLDDVSTVFADPILLESRRGAIAPLLADRSLVDGLGLPGRQRGNSRDNDVYNFVSISILKYIGGIECPKISKDL